MFNFKLIITMIGQAKKLLSVFLVACLGGIAGVGIYKTIEKDQYSRLSITDKQHHAQLVNYTSTPIPPEGCDFTKAAEMTVPAVVHVRTFYQQAATYNQTYDPFRDFFGGGRD